MIDRPARHGQSTHGEAKLTGRSGGLPDIGPGPEPGERHGAVGWQVVGRIAVRDEGSRQRVESVRTEPFGGPEYAGFNQFIDQLIGSGQD